MGVTVEASAPPTRLPSPITMSASGFPGPSATQARFISLCAGTKGPCSSPSRKKQHTAKFAPALARAGRARKETAVPIFPSCRTRFGPQACCCAAQPRGTIVIMYLSPQRPLD